MGYSESVSSSKRQAPVLALTGVGPSRDSEDLFLSIAPKYLYFKADQPGGAAELQIDLQEIRAVYLKEVRI